MKDSVASRLYGKERREKLKAKINMLGINYDPNILLAAKFFLSGILFFILLFCGCGVLFSPIIAILFYFIIGFLFIDFRIYLRAHRLEKDALDYIPILLLNLDTSRNIKLAIKNSCDIVDNNLTREFKTMLKQIEVGKSLEEALKEMDTKIPSNYISNIILSLEEANRLGVNVTDSIKKQLELIKENHINYEKRYLKGIPLHIMLLCIICFMIMVAILVLNK